MMENNEEDKTVEILKIAQELNALLLKHEAKPSHAIPALLFVASSGAIFSGNSKERLIEDLSAVFDETERIAYLTGMKPNEDSN